MSLSIDRLREAWSELASHPAQVRRFRTIRLFPDRALDVHAALRAADEAPCLIVDADDPASISTTPFEVGGMRLSHARSDFRHVLILSLEEPARQDLFAAVCSDALDFTMDTGSRVEAIQAFLSRLDAWRLFLKEHQAGLARNEIVGLIGELTILQLLIRHGDRGVSSWQAPLDGLHDFERAGHAIEVKATLGSATKLWISNLDQLDTSGLRHLNLIHVRLTETPDGSSLGEAIKAVAELLPADADRRRFDNALLRRGLMPDDEDARTHPRVAVQSLSAFLVGPTFPRLLRSQVPAGVADANYLLDLQALTPHLCDLNTVLADFIRGIRVD